VIGQLKELLLVLIAMALFGERVSGASAAGIALSALASYGYRLSASHRPQLQRCRGSDSDLGEGKGGEGECEEAPDTEQGLLEMMPLQPMQMDTMHLSRGE